MAFDETGREQERKREGDRERVRERKKYTCSSLDTIIVRENRATIKDPNPDPDLRFPALVLEQSQIHIQGRTLPSIYRRLCSLPSCNTPDRTGTDAART